MEFREVMKRRYSCRHYLDKPVDRTILRELMEAGRISPSACNSQRWAFIAVDDPSLCKELAALMRDDEMGVNRFTGEIPAFVALVQHPPRESNERTTRLLQSEGDSWALIDIGIAAQQICLAATDMGLGSVMLGWFDRPGARRLLGVPDSMEIALFIGIGYPADDHIRKKIRYGAPTLMFHNHMSHPVAE